MPKLKNILPVKARCSNLVERQMDGRKGTKNLIVSFSKFSMLLKFITIIAKAKNEMINT